MSFGGSKTGYLDTKDFRKRILSKAYDRLGVILDESTEGRGNQVNKKSGLLSLLDSYYRSDVPSTNYATHLKAIAFESARFLLIAEQARDDIYFETTRGEYLSQNIASFLFPSSRFPTTDQTDREARNFYLSIIEAYFGGSTPDNIERSLFRFLEGVEVGIVENFMLAREGSSQDPILNKFTFDILVDLNDDRIRDVNKVQSDIEFLLNIIKPAHTTFETKLIFNEFFDEFRNICDYVLDGDGNRVISPDGFEIKVKGENSSICDTEHFDLHDYSYEDLRKLNTNFGTSFIEGEIVEADEFKIFQASPRIPTSILGGEWDQSSRREYHTRYGPLAKEDGNLADSVTDITVTVDEVEVIVEEIYPLAGAFLLEEDPPLGSEVRVTYRVIRNFVGPLVTNERNSVTNNFRNSATTHDYSNVLPPTEFQPIGLDFDFNIWEKSCKYQGFDLFNSSVLNNPMTLNLNEPNLRSRLNDATIFKSFGYDEGEYSSSLREGTPLYPKSLDLKDHARRLHQQQIILTNTEYVLNSAEDRMFGEIHQESYHPFYSALEIDCIDNDGVKNLLQTINEDPVSGLQIELGRAFEDTLNPLGRDYDSPFYTYPTSSGYILSSGYAGTGAVSASGFMSLTNDPDWVIFGGVGTWDVQNAPTQSYADFDDIAEDYPEEADVDFIFGGNHGQAHLLIHDVYHYDINKISVLDEGDQVIEEITNIPYPTLHAADGPSGNLFYLSAQLREDTQAFRVRDRDVDPSLTFHVNEPVLNSLTTSATSIIPGSGSTITKVTNVRGGVPQDYDIEGMVLFGDKVFTLDESNSLNQSIGFEPGDTILVDYTAISKMNSHYELVRQIPTPIEIKFITQEPIFELVSVYNASKSAYYDVSNHEIIGPYIVNLDKNNPTNVSIGFDISDIIIIDYIKRQEVREIIPVTALPGNFLKFEMDTPNEVVSIFQLKVTNTVLGKEKDDFYDLSNLIKLNTNVYQLDGYLPRNILIGQDPEDGDIYEAEVISLEWLENIQGEVAEVVESPYRFKFINIKPIGELISLANSSQQEFYDLTDLSTLVVSSGEDTADNMLVKGTSTDSFDNINNFWSSVGSDDSIPETINIRFNYSRPIDIISLIDHNWADYSIQYRLGEFFVDFDSPVSVVNNVNNRTVHQFNEVVTNEIQITINKTIIPDQDKHICKIIYMLKDIIELDYTSVANHRLGMRYGDIVYSSSISSYEEGNIEPWLGLGRDYNRTLFEISPV